MGATIRKSYTIFTIGSITITVLLLGKVGTRVVIMDSITIFIESWSIISRLMVRIGMVSRPVGRCRCMVDRSWLINWSRGMVVILVVGIEVTMRTGMEVFMGMAIEVAMCKGMEVTLGVGRGNQRIMHKIGTTNIGSGHSQES